MCGYCNDDEPLTDAQTALATEVVARGAELFDRIAPGWWTPERFDVETMRVSSLSYCPAAQVLGDGDWDVALGVLKQRKEELGLRTVPEGYVDVGRYGFASAGDTDEVFVPSTRLTSFWRDVVTTRREANTSV